MTAEGLTPQRSCALRGVSESGYYAWRNRVPLKKQIGHAWVLDQGQAAHEAARGVYESETGTGRFHPRLGVAGGNPQSR